MEREVIWSWGGGVQTIAILVLVAQGRLPKPARVVMANTSRERSLTWRYYEQHARPILEGLGLTLEIVGHDLAKVDLYGHNGDLLLPAFTQTGKLPTFCSGEWKKWVVRRYLRLLEYGPKRPVTMWYGMSLDEVDRLRVSDKKWIRNHYPLCFDVPRRRHECVLEVVNFGLPEPPKSACWCCPHLTNAEWQEIKLHDPADFEQAIQLDHQIRAADRNGGVFLHRSARPLDQADLSIEHGVLPLWECVNSCMT